MRKRTGYLMIVAVAALLALMVAETVNASNMAFKINMVVLGNDSPNCTTCDNWISMPFVNEFAAGTMRDFCDDNADGVIDGADSIGFVSVQGLKTVAFPATFDKTFLDSFITHNCALSFSDNAIYDATRSMRLRPKPAITPNIIYVGSHDPGGQLAVRGPVANGGSGNCSTCDNWVDIPYHTTATKMRDFCDDNGDGLIDAADSVGFVSIQGLKTVAFPATFDLSFLDSFITHNCLLSFSDNADIQIGRSARLRVKTGVGDVLVSPSHF